jgi:hypothetical protein
VIKNKTRKTIISENYLNKNALGKIKGLIGNKTPEAIILKTRFGIHTFLLRFPIDVIIIDKNNKVRKLKKKLAPNKVFFWNIKFDTVIELPGGAIEKSKTQTGDILQLS